MFRWARRSVLRWPASAALAAGVAGLACLGCEGRDPAADLVIPRPSREIDAIVTRLIDEHVALVESAPGDARAHGTLGLVYEANGFWAEAQQSFANARSLDPGEVLWPYHMAIAMRQAGDVEGSSRSLKALASEHRDFASLLHQHGNALLEAGETRDAARVFQRVIELEPGRPEGYVGLADTKLRQGDHAGAAALLEPAIEIDPGYRTAHYLLGLAYRGLGREDDAARELAKGLNALVRYMPDALTAQKQRFTVSVSGRLVEADTMLEYGRPAEAAAVFEDVLAAQPADVGVINSLATAYIRTNQVERAYALLRRAHEIDSTNYLTLMNLAVCCLTLNRPAEALQYAERGLERRPDVAKIHVVHGVVLASLQRYAESRAALLEAQRLDARDPQIHTALGEVCYRLARYDESRQHYIQAVKLLPDSLQAQVALCEVCITLGDAVGAEAALQAVQRLAPNNPQVLALERRVRQLGR